MGKLSDILQNGDGDRMRRVWDSTKAADELAPLPTGTYLARLISGELFTSRTNGTPGYKLAFRVLDGDHAGRQFWHDVWLTEAALPMTKRDLARLGVTSLEQLEAPLPKGIRCSVKVVLQTADDGTRFNKVKSFQVVGIDPPDADPFAPVAKSSSDPPAHDLTGAALPDNPDAEPPLTGQAEDSAGNSTATSEEIPF